jgi:seryl-tRNA synthetase
MPFLNAADIVLTSDNSVTLKNRRAIERTHEMRAEREQLALQVEPLRRRIKELSQRIAAAEKAAYED